MYFAVVLIESVTFEQCTPTTDTSCTQGLQPSAIVAIVTSVVLVVVVMAAGIWYGRSQRVRYTLVTDELAMASQLLVGAQDENARFVEDAELMDQGFRISEEDLIFGDVIGVGGNGRVFAGTWG